jgi:hypothetical protein
MARDTRLDVHTFRTRGGLQVDFVASTPAGATWAIEAKATANLRPRDAEPLEAARGYLPPQTRAIIVIPTGHPRRLSGGVEILPLARLLEEVG